MRDRKESALSQVVRALWVAVVIAVGGPVLVESFARPPATPAPAQWRGVEPPQRPVSEAEAAASALTSWPSLPLTATRCSYPPIHP